jgi:RNA polymerase sigma-70 factor (ECF subfamily)
MRRCGMFNRQDDDLKLIQGLKAQDESALNKCINQYHSYVSCIVANIIGKAFPQEDIEEVMMDVFLAIWNHADTIDISVSLSLKPYIGTVARNKAKNKLRTLSKFNSTILLEDEIAIDTKDFTKDILNNELKGILLETLNELNKDERICFINYYYYQKSIRLISEETGINESTIKSKLSRGRGKLKELLERKGFRYEDIDS